MSGNESKDDRSEKKLSDEFSDLNSSEMRLKEGIKAANQELKKRDMKKSVRVTENVKYSLEKHGGN